MDNSISRRELLKMMGAGGLGFMASSLIDTFGLQQSMMTRTIPSSGEVLPVVGLGTWIQYDVGSSQSERVQLSEVLKRMAEHGGKVIDSSPMYGNSEQVVGELTSELGLQDAFFYATKVWTSGRDAGIRQMNDSMQKMRRQTMDLMQIHNLVDWQTHIKILREWKEQGKIRYIGITHYTDSSHARLEEIIRSENIDFVQFNYSIQDRHAEESLLATARQHETAVIVNGPYGGGSLFGLTKGQQIPAWAKEYDIASWGQFFLKYIISNPAVTCVIPGTSDPEHLTDNMKAGYGRMPDEKTRKRMVEFVENL